MIPMGVLGGVPRGVLPPGGDPHWSSVVSLLHFDGADGATAFPDAKGKAWAASGNAKLSTAQAKWGASSLLCDGTGDYLGAASSTDFSLTAAGDFTVEFWLYLLDKDNNDGNTIICVGNGTGYWQLLVRNNNIQINVRNAANSATSDLFAPLTLANDSWHHYAWTRASGTNRIFYDGAQVSSAGGIGGSPMQGSHAAYIGANFNGGTSSTHGYIDDVRITKGVARYTSAFTPPAAPFPSS